MTSPQASRDDPDPPRGELPRGPVEPGIRVALAADSALILIGLRAMIEQRDGLTVILEARSGAELTARAERRAFEVLIIDPCLRTGDALTAIEVLRERSPELRVIAISSHDSEHDVSHAMSNGADAFLSARVEPGDVASLISQIAGGATVRPGHPGAADDHHLTAREKEVLALVGAGRTNREIASLLFVTDTTVKFHLSNTYRKLGVRNRAGAVRKAFALGLADFDNAA